jgi:hypothetical protein
LRSLPFPSVPFISLPFPSLPFPSVSYLLCFPCSRKNCISGSMV